MEILGIVLLLGLFCMGLVVIYLFLQYIALLKAEQAFQEEILKRLKKLEQGVESLGLKEQGTVLK